MKKIVLISTISAMTLFATNGDSLIGLGSKSRGMGGVGIVTYFGAENALSNPALLTKLKHGFEFDFGATYFAPNVKVNGKSSKADKNMIPEISIGVKANDRLSYGIGMFGSAGMGVDFRDETSLFKARTNLLLMKIAPSVAYKVNSKFSIGFAPVLQYGALQIGFKTTTQVGNGVSDDFGLGFEAGAFYQFTSTSRVGFVYKSAIDMNYKDQISDAATAFGLTMGDHLEQPEEYGIGLCHKYGPYKFAIDYKKIKWSKAKGYKDFGWDDQDVYALGAIRQVGGSWYSIGYNYAKTPLKTAPAGSATERTYNTLNYLMFPGTAETHYTFGYGKKLTKNLTFGFNIVYAPKTTKTVKGWTLAPGMTPTDLKTEHSETSTTMQLKYNF